MKHPVAFIDADILLYRAVSFVDDEFDGEEMTDYRQAEQFFDGLLRSWIEGAGKLSDFYMVLSVGKNFRKDLFPDYKANRKDLKKHPALWPLKDLIKERDGVIWEEGIEADDLIGIRCTEDQNTIAISADKDFATVPCRLYIPPSHGRTKGRWFNPSEDEANMNWLRQALTGDTIDNYKGIPGIGPKKAEAIIPSPAPLDQMWEAVKGAYLKAGMTEDNAILMARLARILRAGDYDFEKKEVKLWNPSANTAE